MGEERGVGRAVKLKWWRWRGLASRSWAGFPVQMTDGVQSKVLCKLCVLWTRDGNKGEDEKDEEARKRGMIGQEGEKKGCKECGTYDELEEGEGLRSKYRGPIRRNKERRNGNVEQARNRLRRRRAEVASPRDPETSPSALSHLRQRHHHHYHPAGLLPRPIM